MKVSFDEGSYRGDICGVKRLGVGETTQEVIQAESVQNLDFKVLAVGGGEIPEIFLKGGKINRA